MKKLVCLAFAVVCLSACGSKTEPLKTMKCSVTTENTGYSVELKVDMEYRGTEVEKQIQETNMVADSAETYAQLEEFVKQKGYEETFKDLSGVNYTLNYSSEKQTINELIKMDLTKITTKDYRTISGDKTIDIEKSKIDIDKTKEKLEGQGLTCKK